MLSCMNIMYNNIDCLNDRFTYFYTTSPIKEYTVLKVLVVIFLIYCFSLYIPIFDLIHAVDTTCIVIPLKQEHLKIVCEI